MLKDAENYTDFSKPSAQPATRNKVTIRHPVVCAGTGTVCFDFVCHISAPTNLQAYNRKQSNGGHVAQQTMQTLTAQLQGHQQTYSWEGKQMVLEAK